MIEKALKMLAAKKKQGPQMSDQEKEAKISVLQDLRGQAMEKMGEGLKKSKSSGLKKGVEKAEETVESTNEESKEHEVESDIGVGGESGESYGHSPDEQASEEIECSEEEKALSESEIVRLIGSKLWDIEYSLIA
jgi:hypothetical protein